jgi:hypothetical protein
MPLILNYLKKGKMKIKQLLTAAIIVISALTTVTSCKKDSSLTPQIHQRIKLALGDSTALNGGDGGTIKPPKP